MTLFEQLTEAWHEQRLTKPVVYCTEAFLNAYVDALLALNMGGPRDTLLQGAAKWIEVLSNANRSKTDRLQHEHELCLRQSAGDSTSPQIDVPPDRLGEFSRDDDVPVEELATRFEDPEHLAECLPLVRRQINHTVADDEVDALRVDRYVQDIACSHLHVRKTQRSG